MRQKQGFTMVELLATISILGMIMLIAIPNVLSIIDKNKKRTYVEDAKKMQVLAEYKLRSDTSIEKPKNGYAIAITLQSMDMTELAEAPEGGEYAGRDSFVLISNENGTYKYYVALKEVYDGGTRGLNLTDLSVLNSESAIRNIVGGTNMKTYNLITGIRFEKGGIIQDVY